MVNPLEQFFDIKGIIATVVFVFVIVMLLLVLNELQKSPLGQNEQAKQSLESAKSSINILFNGYFLIEAIAGIAGLIAIFLLLKDKFEGGGIV